MALAKSHKSLAEAKRGNPRAQCANLRLHAILAFMAIAFARISYHSRSQGHSAVAGAAYRAGVTLLDERTGEVHDFKNRDDVAYTKILLPEGAAEYFNDRETLWNAVESAETRKNSQVAKDIILALPRDLDLSHQIDLAHNFANYHFVRHGLVADIAIHDHSDGNPHAHIYVTTRRLHGDRFDKYKARDLEPDVARGRVVDPQYWGEQWREFQNQYFQDHDIDLLVDANHILTQRHEGRIRGSGAHYLKEENQLRREASVEIAVNDPTSVLNLLGTKHAVFSERDIALLIHKNTDTREEYETALLNLKTHRDLILLGPGDDGRDRYTTRANYQREASMAEHAQSLNLAKKYVVEPKLVKQATHNFRLNSEQSEALSHIAQSGDICAVVGRAGTGKSYMMKAARQMWESSGYQVRGMAVSGIASKGLEKDSGIASMTIHSLKMRLAFGSLQLSENDVLVMDEAGMTDLHDMALVIDAVREAGAKLVLVGDHAQLQPVGPGAPYRAIVEQIGFSELNQIQRQDEPGDCAASILLSRGSVGQAIDYYAQKQQVHLVVSNQEEEDDEDGGGATGSSSTAIRRLVSDWSNGLSAESIDERLILAHRNIDVAALNTAARLAMQELGLLGQSSKQVKAIDGNILLSSGDRIIFLRNNKQLGISNGEFANVIKIDGDQITVRLSGKQTREMTFSNLDYQDFNYGYAATVHKSQGTTFDHTFVYVAGRAWDRFLAYVSMTRHRRSLNVYADQNQFHDLDALKATLSRAVLKDSVLDWPISFAIHRGFDPESMIGRFIDKVAGIKQSIHDKWLFVTNYAAFKTSRAHQKLQQTKEERREMAKKVALFIDLRNSLGATARLMRQDLKQGEKFYQHHDYSEWYEQTLLKNKLAFEINAQYDLFEKALTLNRLHKNSLEKMASDHQRYLNVKSYLTYYQQGEQIFCHQVAQKIQPDLDKHFSAIMFETKKQGLTSANIIRQIGLDAITHQRLTPSKDSLECEKHDTISENFIHDRSDSLADEWKRLKTLKSHVIDRVLMAKERLDKASKPLGIEIQTRGLENAVKSLCKQEKLFSKVKTVAPNLAKSFEKISQPLKEVTIDWSSNEYNLEFDNLRQSKDKSIQYLVKFRDKLIEAKDTPKEKALIKQLESTAISIMRYKRKQDVIKQLAPKLAAKLFEFAKFKSKQKDIGRDL